ncbi:MAG: hypothetical protein ABJX32_21190 [Tateyamaria sp.]|uniref:hypothetical protein n=1 Tax=Tateyamaria sp. TaxID=1929288 RepID=UPI0032A0D221
MNNCWTPFVLRGKVPIAGNIVRAFMRCVITAFFLMASGAFAQGLIFAEMPETPMPIILPDEAAGKRVAGFVDVFNADVSKLSDEELLEKLRSSTPEDRLFTAVVYGAGVEDVVSDSMRLGLFRVAVAQGSAGGALLKLAYDPSAEAILDVDLTSIQGSMLIAAKSFPKIVELWNAEGLERLKDLHTEAINSSEAWAGPISEKTADEINALELSALMKLPSVQASLVSSISYLDDMIIRKGIID